MAYTIKINATAHTVDVDGDTPMLWVLRDVLGMTGTKFGCGRALCGACTVHVDGAATRSCITPIDSIGDSAITTIEAVGLTPQGKPLRHLPTHPRRHPSCRDLREDMTMLDSSLTPQLDRRNFLKGSAAFGGGLVVTLTLPVALRPSWAQAEASPSFAPNAFIRIDRQGAVTLVMPMVEMGQGTYTSLAMLLAEELEVGLDQVRLEHAPPNDALYANALLHRQLTGMSSSIRAFWTPLRQAGAVARTLLITAAAKQWGVDPAVCWARHGVVSAGPRQLSYGQLVDAAAALPVPTPDSLALKDPKDFTLIGTPAKRLDTPDKVNGHAEFGIDTKQPGMKVAAIAISPVFGGKPKSL